MILDQCLRLDSEDRFDSFSTAIRVGKTLLRNQHLKGMSLFDLMSACSQHILRSSQEVEMLEAATAMFDRNTLAPEILEMEAERKRQKLKEVNWVTPIESLQDDTDTSEMDAVSQQSPANLLDMLRQSSIASPEVPEIQTPPPKPEKPQTALGNDLLSALRSSVSQPVDKTFGEFKSQPPVPETVSESSDKVGIYFECAQKV